MELALTQELWNDIDYKKEVYDILYSLGPDYEPALENWRIGIELMSREHIRTAIRLLNPDQ